MVKKFAALGPSLACVAMMLVIWEKPLDSVLAWVAFGLALVSLVFVNVSYILLYNRWTANQSSVVPPDKPSSQ
jgi:hypothetical protein